MKVGWWDALLTLQDLDKAIHMILGYQMIKTYFAKNITPID